MKKRILIPLARITSSLFLFGILLCIHMNFTLLYFLPSESKRVMNAVYIFFFTGVALGAVLCPLLLPLPGKKNKSSIIGICFVIFLTSVEFISRSLGFRVWLDSAIVRSVMAVPEGILTTMCYGLFYLTWLQKPRIVTANWSNRTGVFCSLVLSTALIVSVLVRFYSVPLIEASSLFKESAFLKESALFETSAAENQMKGAAFVFSFIKWCMLVTGLSSGFCVFLTHNATAGSASAGKNSSAELIIITNRPVILRLISLASMFTILNMVLNMRMLPLYSIEAIYNPHYLTVAAMVPVLGFLAGRSMERFIRWFLPPAIVLFILMSCLPLFEDHPRFNTVMSTLVAVAHYTVWAVFSTAVVEYYAGGFWFYGIATVIFSSVCFSFFAPVIDPFVPDSTEYRVLFIVISAVFFMLLAFRLIISKEPYSSITAAGPFPETSVFESVFRKHGLSQREIEVANLMVMEGLGNKEIGEKLFISLGTAKLHISRIYQKFAVNNQREFMALFVNKE